MVSGLELTSQKVGGRAISDRRWYTLATTRSLADTLVKLVRPISRYEVGQSMPPQQRSQITTFRA